MTWALERAHDWVAKRFLRPKHQGQNHSRAEVRVFTDNDAGKTERSSDRLSRISIKSALRRPVGESDEPSVHQS